MSPLPPADTSSQQDRPVAPADPPTQRNTSSTRVRGTGTDRKNRPTKAPMKSGPIDHASLDDALGAPMRAFSTRASEEVLELLKARAAEIAELLPAELRGGGPGGAMRLVVTDALIHALGIDLDAHAERVRQTRGRELTAQAKARVG